MGLPNEAGFYLSVDSMILVCQLLSRRETESLFSSLDKGVARSSGWKLDGIVRDSREQAQLNLGFDSSTISCATA